MRDIIKLTDVNDLLPFYHENIDMNSKLVKPDLFFITPHYMFFLPTIK